MSDRVLLVEDSAAMRAAIESILAGACEIVGHVEDGRDVLSRAMELRPGAIILDISLPGKSGLALLPDLRELLPDTNIIILTNHTDEGYRREALLRGANTYVVKSDAGSQLLPAILRSPCPEP